MNESRGLFAFHLSTLIIVTVAAGIMAWPQATCLRELCSENISNSPDWITPGAFLLILMFYGPFAIFTLFSLGCYCEYVIARRAA